MTGKEFMRAVAHGQVDLVQALLDILAETGTAYAVIGGLAVNAYAEPVVSLDLDIIVAADNVEKVAAASVSRGLRVETFEHSVNLSTEQSDLRIQLQTDNRYQDFITRAKTMNVLGYRMRVAAIEDVLQGKIWAFQDAARPRSKRQKDLAEIIRLVESRPELEGTLPLAIRKQIQ